MKIRFRQTTPSLSPGYPFVAGQIIEVPGLTDEHRQWLTEERIEIVEGEPEAAVLGDPDEMAVSTRAKSRGKR